MNADQARFYLAAMIDGEGYVGCSLDSRGFWCRQVAIANTDMALIEATAECCDLLGIDYRIKEQKKQKEHHNTCLLLRITGRENLKILLEEVPLRSPKKLRTLQLAVSTPAKKKYLTTNQQKEVVRKFQDGWQVNLIAAETGITANGVRAVLKRLEVWDG